MYTYPTDGYRHKKQREGRHDAAKSLRDSRSNSFNTTDRLRTTNDTNSATITRFGRSNKTCSSTCSGRKQGRQPTLHTTGFKGQPTRWHTTDVSKPNHTKGWSRNVEGIPPTNRELPTTQVRERRMRVVVYGLRQKRPRLKEDEGKR